MARRLPDLSARPIVIRGSDFKVGLLFAAIGLVLAWFGIGQWDSGGFDWAAAPIGALMLLMGLWMMTSGPMVVEIGDDVVSVTQKGTWWTLPSTSEWRVSEFEHIRCDVTPWEDGSTSYDVTLQHRSGLRVNLVPGYPPLGDGDYALALVNCLEKMLKLPVEWNEP